MNTPRYDRAAVIQILTRWQLRELSDLEVVDAADELREEWRGTDPYEHLDIPKDDTRSIVLEVLVTLSTLFSSDVLAEDIPTMLEFLETPAGAEASGWAAWEAYWDKTGWNRRQDGL